MMNRKNLKNSPNKNKTKQMKFSSILFWKERRRNIIFQRLFSLLYKSKIFSTKENMINYEDNNNNNNNDNKKIPLNTTSEKNKNSKTLH